MTENVQTTIKNLKLKEKAQTDHNTGKVIRKDMKLRQEIVINQHFTHTRVIQKTEKRHLNHVFIHEFIRLH